MDKPLHTFFRDVHSHADKDVFKNARKYCDTVRDVMNAENISGNTPLESLLNHPVLGHIIRIVYDARTNESACEVPSHPFRNVIMEFNAKLNELLYKSIKVREVPRKVIDDLESIKNQLERFTPYCNNPTIIDDDMQYAIDCIRSKTELLQLLSTISVKLLTCV